VANHATSCSHVDCVHTSYSHMNPNQSIKTALFNQMNVEYRVCVNTSLLATKVSFEAWFAI